MEKSNGGEEAGRGREETSYRHPPLRSCAPSSRSSKGGTLITLINISREVWRFERGQATLRGLNVPRHYASWQQPQTAVCRDGSRERTAREACEPSVLNCLSFEDRLPPQPKQRSPACPDIRVIKHAIATKKMSNFDVFETIQNDYAKNINRNINKWKAL